MKNWKNWMKNFWKNKKLMHRVLVGGIVAVCLVGMAAAGMRMRDLPGTLDGDRVNTAGKVADDQDGETAEQAEGLPEEETAAGEDSDIGLEGTADDGNDSDGSAADTSTANGSGTKAGGVMSDQNSSGQSASGQSQGGTGAQNGGGGQSQTGGKAPSGQNSTGSSGSSGGQTGSQNSGGSTGQSTGSGQGTQEATEISCTISIRCDSISGNGILTANGHPELESYAANPVILGSTAVKVKKGASVYDVLLQACRSAGIHLESSYTPAYGSYYVQGINHLYEWQAGPGSGWTYTVNGRSVSVGASACKLSDGDVIVWEYVHR